MEDSNIVAKYIEFFPLAYKFFKSHTREDLKNIKNVSDLHQWSFKMGQNKKQLKEIYIRIYVNEF